MPIDSLGRKDSKEVFSLGGIYCERWGKGGVQNGITGTEIRNGAVQTQTLRLHSSTITGRTEAEAQGIRLQHRAVYVWVDPTGYPGAAGKRTMPFCGSLMTHFHCLLPAVISSASGRSWARIGSNSGLFCL